MEAVVSRKTRLTLLLTAVTSMGCSGDATVLFPECTGPSCASSSGGGGVGGGSDGGGTGGAAGGACMEPAPITLAEFDGYAFDYLSIALDAGNIYYAMGNQGSRVWRVDKNGGEPDTLLALSQEWVTSLAVDDAYVYVTIVTFPDADTDHNELVRIPKTGGAPETLTASEYYADALIADATSLYWRDWEFHTNQSRLMKLPKAGGDATILFDGYFDGISMDDERLYVASAVGAVSVLPKQGGALSVVVDGENVPFSVCADSSSLYWATNDNRIRTIAKTGGGGAHDVLLAQGIVRTLVVRDERMIWAEWSEPTIDSARLLESKTDGSAVRVIASMQANPAAVSSDSSDVYWLDMGHFSFEGTSADPASHALLKACH